MITIRFDNPQMERRGLGYLAGRFNGRTWKSGETLVPEEALAHLAAEGIAFTVTGKPSYQKLYAPLGDTAAVAV